MACQRRDSGRAQGGRITNPSIGGPHVTYTPVDDYFGIDTFTYRLVGADAPDYVRTVTIDVVSVLDPLVLVDDSVEFVNQGEPVEVDVIANDSGEALAIVSVTQGGLGTVSIQGTSVVYTPDPGVSGTDLFDYVATDGTTQATATVTVTMTAPTIVTSTTTTTTTTQPSTTTPTTTTAPVVGTTTSTPIGVLPATGGSDRWLVALALVALALGAWFVRVARPRT
ncbi:MAG: Ig-like domain-containing protein [Acidimicrobiia bacterium]